MEAKTGEGLAAYAKAQIGRPYWWGCFGQTASEALYQAKKQQYPSYYQQSDYSGQYGQRVHDCSGLVMGYIWSETPDSPPKYNAAQDGGVRGLWNASKRRGGLNTIPETPGTLVFEADLGHVGVYVGNGTVVEAMGHAYGVVKTRLRGRQWAYWGQPSYIDYSQSESQPQVTADEGPVVLAAQESVYVTQPVQLPILRRGAAVSGWVKNLQVLLIAHGHYCGGKIVSGRELPDGDFGPTTETAVKEFQGLMGLEKDGEAGKDTWTALLGR